MENVENFCGMESNHRWTWKDKLRCRLFPPTHCPFPDAPPTHKDVLIVRVVAELSFLDRVILLASGGLIVENRTVTEHVIGGHVAASAVWTLPPIKFDPHYQPHP